MLILDTDHLTEYQRGTSAQAHRLKWRLDQATEPYVTTIITVEEIMRGWMAAIRRLDDPQRQIDAYLKLQQMFHFFASWRVLPWEEKSVHEFAALKRSRIRVGTMDLKIAAITLAHNATLLSRNRSDFEKVPGLQLEDWLS